MIKRWNGMDTFAKISVAMVLLWIIGACTIAVGHKVIGCVLIWLAVVIDVVAIIVVLWKKKEERKKQNGIT